MPDAATKDRSGRLVHLGARVEAGVHDAFTARARSLGKSAAAHLRDLAHAEADLAVLPPRPSGAARKLDLRLRDDARASLLEGARERGITPAAYATAILELVLLGKAEPRGPERDRLRQTYLAFRLIRDTSREADVKALAQAAMNRVERAMRGETEPSGSGEGAVAPASAPGDARVRARPPAAVGPSRGAASRAPRSPRPAG